MNRVLHLSDRWSWMGSHSGYDRFLDRLDEVESVTLRVAPRRFRWLRSNLSARLRGGAWCCSPRSQLEEKSFLDALNADPQALGHVHYAERHHPLFQEAGVDLERVVGTIHHPLSQARHWHPELLRDLGRLRTAIVLFRQGAEVLAGRSRDTRVHFIPHGVDTRFFCPNGSPTESEPSLLFVGENGRDLGTLKRVIDSVSAAHPKVCFDLVIPALHQKPRSRMALAALWGRDRIRWWSNLPDLELRERYRKATALVLPLTSSGASNTVVEALACGLPVVTGRSEGIEDYGGGSAYPLARNEQELSSLCLRYLAEPRWREDVSAAVRRFAVEQLPWERIAKLHEQVYASL